MWVQFKLESPCRTPPQPLLAFVAKAARTSAASPSAPPETMPGKSARAAWLQIACESSWPQQICGEAWTPEEVSHDRSQDSGGVATVLHQSSFRRQATSGALRDHIRNETRANIPAWSEGVGAFLHKASVRIVRSWVFELYILAAIILNSVIIGIEAELRLDDGNLEWAAPVEVVLLGIYTIEIILRVLAGGSKIFCEGWFLFDLSLVVFSYLERLLAGVAGEAQQQIIVLRLLRLFRLIRSFRMVKQIKPLWRLVHGLMASADTVLSTLMLLLLLGRT